VERSDAENAAVYHTADDGDIRREKLIRASGKYGSWLF